MNFSDRRFIVCALKKRGIYRAEFDKLGNVEQVGVLELLRYVRQFKEDGHDLAIMGWMYHSCLVAALCSLLNRKVRLTFNIRQSIERLRHFKFSTRVAISLVAISTWLFNAKLIYVGNRARSTHEKMYFKRGNSDFIYNGFSVDSRDILRSRSPPSLDLFQQLAIRNKKIEFMICGMAELANLGKDATLDLYGEGLDIHNKELLKTIEKFRLSHAITLHGRLRDRETIFTDKDWYLQTSSMEGMSNSIGEAMGFGLPVVCSDVGDNALMIDKMGLHIRGRSRCLCQRPERGS